MKFERRKLCDGIFFPAVDTQLGMNRRNMFTRFALRQSLCLIPQRDSDLVRWKPISLSWSKHRRMFCSRFTTHLAVSAGPAQRKETLRLWHHRARHSVPHPDRSRTTSGADSADWQRRSSSPARKS